MLCLTNDIRQGINEKVLIPTPDNNLSGAGDLYVSGLSGYGDKYTVIDNRKRARKEPGDLLANKNLSFRKTGKAAENYNKDAYDDSKYKRVVIVTNFDGLYLEFFIFKAITKATENTKSEPGYSIKKGADGKYYKGTPQREIVKANIKDLYNIIDYIPSYRQAYVTNEIYQKYYNTALNQFFDNLKKTIKYFQDALEKDKSKLEKDKSNNKYISELVQQIESNLKEAQKVYNYNIAFYNYDTLGKPTIKFEFENNDELKNFLKENKENLIDSYIDVDSDSEKADYSRKRLNGLTHNAEQYNYKELDTKGYAPTYEILSNYDNLIESSDGKILEVGKGFADTCECLKNAVLKGLPQVERLAKLLQDPAGNIAQSCFNVWHFLQKNVRYNFDRTGKEDIRLPARTWADREKGVDCDCLSVFAFCLLANMGLKPVFEIVAFFGKDSYSHIYVNCQGVIVDRVLQKFNERAPFITKIKKMEIPVYQLSGVEDDGLEGVNDVLKNLKSQIPQNHNCQIRKQIAYKRMAGNPVEQRAFAMFMPYMYDVDLHNGALYFYRPEFATVAKWADSILANYFRNAQQCTDLQGVELGKLFKKIGKALKKAAKSVAKATKKVVKATGNVVKSAVKSTANVVKSTANVFKAGAQLATGKKAAAKATIKKAGSQIKSAVVEPVKSTANLTKTVVKETIVNPTKTAVKAVAKLVKVLLIKINPVTVLMRNSLRGLIAINFLGLASKLAVGKMTQSDAEKAGYDKSSWEKAVKAYNRVIKFFKNLGGDVSKMEKSITNGAKKKALFKKNNNYNINAPISESDLQGLGALGEGVTIGTMLAAVGGFFAKIWGWIKNVVPKVANFVKNSGVGEKLKNAALNKLDEKLNNNKDSEFTDAQFNDDTPATDTTRKNWILPALLIGGAVAAVAMSGKRK
jgi:hypothetical protein